MVLDALALLVIVLKGSVFDCMVLYAISEHMLLNGMVKKMGWYIIGWYCGILYHKVWYWRVLYNAFFDGMVSHVIGVYNTR